MSLNVDPLSGGAFGPALCLFNEQGLWTPGAGFVTTATVENGDLQIAVNALPNDGAGGITTNLFAPILAPLPGVPAAGAGKYLRLDPAGEDVQVQIRSVAPFEEPGGGGVIIYLESPVEGLSAPLGASAQIGMGHSPVFNVHSFPKEVVFKAVSHEFDARGNGRTASPAIDLQLFMSDNPAGPFVSVGTISGGGFSSATGQELVLAFEEFTFPPMAYGKIVPSVGGGDDGGTVFSLVLSRGLRI